jgi:3-oxoacyl-[acyl-carrier protein] reductase
LDLDPAKAETASLNAQPLGAKASAYGCDVTSREQVEACFSSAHEHMGGLDILITCAGGYNSYAGLEDISESEWDRIIELNLKSVFLCCRAALPYMKKISGSA